MRDVARDTCHPGSMNAHSLLKNQATSFVTAIRGAPINRFNDHFPAGYSAWRNGGAWSLRAAGAVDRRRHDNALGGQGRSRDINRAVGRRWQGLDPLLPTRAEFPEGCAAPFVTTGSNGRPAGLAVVPPRARPGRHTEPDLGHGGPVLADRCGCARQDTPPPSTTCSGSGATTCPACPRPAPATPRRMISLACDVTGVNALLRHGLQPLTVIAVRARPDPRSPPAPRLRRESAPGHPRRRARGPRRRDRVRDWA